MPRLLGQSTAEKENLEGSALGHGCRGWQFCIIIGGNIRRNMHGRHEHQPISAPIAPVPMPSHQVRHGNPTALRVNICDSSQPESLLRGVFISTSIRWLLRGIRDDMVGYTRKLFHRTVRSPISSERTTGGARLEIGTNSRNCRRLLSAHCLLSL